MIQCVQAWGVEILCTLHTIQTKLHNYCHSVVEGCLWACSCKNSTHCMASIMVFSSSNNVHIFVMTSLAASFTNPPAKLLSTTVSYSLGSRASRNQCLLCCKTCEPLKLLDLKISILCPSSSEVGGGGEIPCENDGVHNRWKVMKSTLTA